MALSRVEIAASGAVASATFGDGSVVVIEPAARVFEVQNLPEATDCAAKWTNDDGTDVHAAPSDDRPSMLRRSMVPTNGALSGMRQFTSTALSRASPYLTAAMSVRNAFVEPPYCPENLVSAPELAASFEVRM